MTQVVIGRMTRDERLHGIVSGTETRVSPRWSATSTRAVGWCEDDSGAIVPNGVRVTYADGSTEIRTAGSFRGVREQTSIRQVRQARQVPDTARIALQGMDWGGDS